MKANDDFDDTNDFAEAFMNESDQDTAQVVPEEVMGDRPVKKKKKSALLQYLIYAVGGLVLLFVVLVIWAVVSSDDSGPADQQQTVQQNTPAVTMAVPPTPTTDGSHNELATEDDFDDINMLRSQLKSAQENTAIRDEKYKALARAYVQLQADYKLLKEKEDKANGKTLPRKPEYSVLPVVKGVSLVSVYDGYAFIKKGSTVYSIKKGDKVNNADVIEIDPVLRKVITAKGVIE
jgi:hypothetical protein